MKRALFLFAGLALVSCDRTHMTDSYGRSVRMVLHKQVVDPTAGLTPDGGTSARAGLDPQEAAIVHDTYRKSLSPKGSDEAARRAPVLVVPSSPGGPYAPSP